MKRSIVAGLLAAVLPLAASAEVKSAAPDGFLIEHRFTIAAPAAKVWESLQHPERWWPADHTWSGKRENLSLDAKVGGCFCERWDGNSVEHGRVVLLMPGKMLRLDAALGPLQEMAVSGVITVSLEGKDGATTAVVTHRVSGDPSHKLDALAPVVDQVNGQQFGGMAADAAKN
ncbi:MAG TPA: SRPBCC domain-containing protein [Steroidobacteraceae bacterium]|nr:SRPBCC domain-containing protein [Steroidobacteraceae bacterium]